LPKHVVIVDVDRLQSYVFATHRLREIRGASALISRVQDDAAGRMERIAGEGKLEWLTSCGGTLRALVDCDADRAEQIAVEASQMFVSDTHLATATAHVVPVSDEKRVGAALTQAERKLREKKNSQVVAPWFPSHPLFRLCDLCGQFPAMRESGFAPGETDRWLLCDACLMKSDHVSERQQSSSTRSSLDGGEATGELGPTAVETRACRLAAESLAGIWGHVGFTIPEDLGEVVMRRLPTGTEKTAGARDDDAERRYMGVIYADGNRMGEKWKDLCGQDLTAAQYGELSTSIAGATSEALVQAVVTTLADRQAEEKGRQPSGDRKVLPFIPLIVGGDDVVCVVPGGWALDVAHRFCGGFPAHLEECFKSLNTPMSPPGMSAGVVICKHKFPIQLAMDLAKELLRSAKTRCRELGEPDPGAIDFAVVSDDAPRSLASVRESSYKAGTLNLTERPYLATDSDGTYLGLAALTGAAGVLLDAGGDAKVPRSKWKRLSELLRDKDEEKREFAYAEWRAGLSAPQQCTWAEACKSLKLDPSDAQCAGASSHARVAQVDNQPCQFCGLLDLIELLDILEGGR